MIYGIIEFKKMYALTTKNFCNLNTYQIIEILLVLYSAYVVPQNQDKFIFILISISIKISSTNYITLTR